MNQALLDFISFTSLIEDQMKSDRTGDSGVAIVCGHVTRSQCFLFDASPLILVPCRECEGDFISRRRRAALLRRRDGTGGGVCSGLDARRAVGKLRVMPKVAPVNSLEIE